MYSALWVIFLALISFSFVMFYCCWLNFVLFGGHTWRCSQATPGSFFAQDHSWRCLGSYMGYQGLNLDLLHAIVLLVLLLQPHFFLKVSLAYLFFFFLSFCCIFELGGSYLVDIRVHTWCYTEDPIWCWVQTKIFPVLSEEWKNREDRIGCWLVDCLLTSRYQYEKNLLD